MVEPSSDTPGIRILPPLLFVGALAIGALLQWLAPIAPGARLTRWILGGVLVVVSLAVALWAMGAFRRAGTAFDVRRAASALVTDGAYRYSRNPGYVALVAATVGIALLVGNPWIVLALVPAVVVLQGQVVAREERHLEARFGEDYRAYTARVRRWL